VHRVPTFPAFPVFRNKCTKCQGYVELIATIPSDKLDHFMVACFQCPTTWEKATTPNKAVEAFTEDKVVAIE